MFSNNLFQVELARFEDVILEDELVDAAEVHDEVVGVSQQYSDDMSSVEEKKTSGASFRR